MNGPSGPSRGPIMLIILDGWGIAPPSDMNAITKADTPVMDSLTETYPYTTLNASGEAVGLPDGQMGNSEVGHLNLGAGRIVYQDFTRINLAIKNGEFQNTPALVEAMDRVLEKKGKLHLIGLLSDGGVHSHMDHIYALVRMAKSKGVPSIQVHALLDGRDTPPTSGIGYVKDLEEMMRSEGAGRISTVMGRFWGMDRDKRWDRVERAYKAMTGGEGKQFQSAEEAVRTAYNDDQTDEFVEPSVITDENGHAEGLVEDGDAIVFFNFRADRAREITRAFTEDGFDDFNREIAPKLSDYVCMTQYDETFDLPVAFPPIHLKNIFGEIVSKAGLKQLRIAETEKYAHVTFFFNGGEEEPFPLEERRLIPSPREVKTYDLKPEMSAYPVAEETVKRLKEGKYDLIVLNFANGDMVGHTGVFSAAVKACEAVDACLGKIVNELLRQNGTAIVTADHGNAEQEWDKENNEPHTAHTCDPVPCILVDDKRKDVKLRKDGILADVAPTLLEIMGIEVPDEMTGRSLIEK